MKLFIDLCRWVAQKFIVLIIIFIILVLFYSLKDIVISLNIARVEYSGLSNKQTYYYNKILEIKNRLISIDDSIDFLNERIKEREANQPSYIHFINRWKYNQETKALSYVKNLTEKLSEKKQLESKLDNFYQEKAKVEEGLEKYGTILIRVYYKIHRNIYVILFLIIIGPIFWKLIWYYIVAPFSNRFPPIEVLTGQEDSGGHLSSSSPNRNMPIKISQDNPILVKMGYIQQRGSNLKLTTRFLYSWSHPLISYAAGLHQMTKISASEKSDETIFIASGDPETYISEFVLENHPGIVIHPRYIVGISEGIVLKSKWYLKNIHCWLTGQLRYIIFYGSGKIYLEGRGGLDTFSPNPGPSKVEQSLVVGFETKLSYATTRTETFWPYYRNKSQLVDDLFYGNGILIRQISTSKFSENFLQQKIEFILNSIGKLLGF